MADFDTLTLNDLLKAGDRDQIIRLADERLHRLARKMLKSFPAVRRWEQTGDVVQEVYPRLCAAMGSVKFESAKHFWNLAATQIRRELINMSRHHCGAHGIGANHVTGEISGSTGGNFADQVQAPVDNTNDPGNVELWGEFHRQVDLLPAEEKEVFDLIWYGDMPQEEAAKELRISERTLQRRWQNARIRLHEAMKGNVPS